MSETPTADAKLVQYLGEAYSKERELERSLQAHIAMATRKPYEKRLKEHLRETKSHAKQVERRIKQLGGAGTIGTLAKEAASLAKQGTALAKGQLHAGRGVVPGMGNADELQLKNAKTEYSEEHEEIATYQAIETLAEEIGDRDTVKLARQIRREEERMASFLERQIPVLTRAVAKAEIPSGERNGGRRTSRRRRRSGSSKRSTSSSSRSGSSSRGKSSSSRGKSSSSRSGSSSRGRSSGRGRRTASSGRRKSGSRS